MALDYTLNFEANVSPDTLLTKVAKITGLPKVSKNELQDESSSFTVTATSSTKIAIDYFIEEHGFVPSSSLYMTHGKGEFEQRRSGEFMVSIAVMLLQAYQGALVLEFCQSDGPMLERKKQEIFVNSEWIYHAGVNRLSDAGLSQTVIGG